MSPDRSAQLLFRVAVALIGVALLAAGAIAVFVTDNGTGSAALVGVGAALLLAAGLWERLESFELGGAKLSLRDEARPVAASYELVSELPPGPERGVALEGVVAEARAAARQRPHEPAEVRQLFERGTDGERIYVLGLMQEDERLRPDKSEVLRLVADATALRDGTGWAPKVTLRDGLTGTVAWFSDPQNLARYRTDRFVL